MEYSYRSSRLVRRTISRVAAPVVAVLISGFSVAPAQTVANGPPEDTRGGARMGFHGARALLGMTTPKNAEPAFTFGGAADLGSIIVPWLRLQSGFSYWSSDIDRRAFGSDAAGTLSDLRIFADTGVRLPSLASVQPFVDVGLALHVVGADVPDDQSLEDALSGPNVGAELGFGVTSTVGKLRLSGEARRQWVQDSGGWSFLFGIGSRWGK